MNILRFTIPAMLTFAAAMALPAFSSCSGNSKSESTSESESNQKPSHPGGPQLGKPGGGPTIDKSDDTTLQAMIKELVPKFMQLEFKDDATGVTMKYNLFSPKEAGEHTSYPLVMFIADASTPGSDYTTPLTQGYGGLVWATDEWQAKHPCYVLVPQFAGVAVNDAYEHTDEADVAIRLLKHVVAVEKVDTNRLYTTGQSMGGMLSMYYNVTYPDLFAASLFVDSHWNVSTFPTLVKHKFVWITAGDSGKSWPEIKTMEEAAEAEGIPYAYTRWSAKLPQAQQDSLATALLSKGAPVNIINFAPGSVLKNGKGSEHMSSFDYAYRLTPVREWMFCQSRVK